jgi:hypothetical protein
MPRPSTRCRSSAGSASSRRFQARAGRSIAARSSSRRRGHGRKRCAAGGRPSGAVSRGYQT